MTLAEIKDLTRFLSEEEAEKIKQEIKSKEVVLKSGNMDEGEMIQVLNTLFAILVIEKTLESEIDEIEEIRAELEEELTQSYNMYDSYMAKYKKEDKKKKKKNWLLNFLFLSENISSKKEGIKASDKKIAKLQKELSDLKQQKSNENLKEVACNHETREKFCEHPGKCRNPRHDHIHHDRRRGRRGREDNSGRDNIGAVNTPPTVDPTQSNLAKQEVPEYNPTPKLKM